MVKVRVIGPAELPSLRSHPGLIDTTSKSPELWTTELSPFHLGPVPLYGGHISRTMENAWQYAKVYRQHLDAQHQPSQSYWHWAEEGWANPRAVRYPMGKGAKPAYSLWEGEQLGYIDARLKLYWTMYQNAVMQTRGFERLAQIAASSEEVVLFDFDGYDNEARNMSLRDVMLNPSRPMGHAFVLKALLERGTAVKTADILGEAPPQQASSQLDLF